MAKDTHICLCRNCNTILIDQESNSGQPKVDLKDYPEATQMQYLPGLKESDSGMYWGCPICLTDKFIIRDK